MILFVIVIAIIIVITIKILIEILIVTAIVFVITNRHKCNQDKPIRPNHSQAMVKDVTADCFHFPSAMSLRRPPDLPSTGDERSEQRSANDLRHDGDHFRPKPATL